MCTESVGKRDDLRVRKTKRAIKRAAAELLSEDPHKRLTVKRLVERAEINKSTFYCHYDSIQDLLDKTDREVLDVVMGGTAGLASMVREDPEGFLRSFSDLVYGEPLFRAGSRVDLRADVLSRLLSDGEVADGSAPDRYVVETVLIGLWGTAKGCDRDEFERRIPSLSAFLTRAFG